MDFYGLNCHLRYMLCRALEKRGELLLKSGLNKKNCRFGHTAFRLRSSFYTSRGGGGSEASIRRMARWGLLANRHGTSFIKFNFNPRVCFLRLLFTQLYGPTYVKQILSGVKNLNDSTETRYDNFSTCIAKLRTL
jgi:hypothetical protein